jgi:hypothetical protein
MTNSPKGLVTMGIDQGTVIHYEIDHWSFPKFNPNDLSSGAVPTLITEGKVNHFEELDDLMYQYSVNFAVIDAQPERRKATEFAHRFNGHVRLCFYPEGINTKQIHISDAGYEPSVSVDRTTWLDTSLGRFKNSTIRLPTNLSFEYKEHIKALVRRYERDKHGNPIGRYRRDSKQDHFAHARTYAEIAMHLGVSVGRTESVANIY